MLLAQYLGANVPSEFGARRGGDLAIDEHPVPPGWIGRTLQQLDPYRTTGVFVHAVKQGGEADAEEITPVPIDHLFREGERVVLLGSKSALDRARLISSPSGG
jgi:Trk K+ transport system NAD-binding subunit